MPARQLFTPFFTTKKGGQGIGLLFVREVLTRHGFAYRLAATGPGATGLATSFATSFDIWLQGGPDARPPESMSPTGFEQSNRTVLPDAL